MEEQRKKGAHLPAMLKKKIIKECISGLKTAAMLGHEHGIKPDTIRTMVSRFKKNNSSDLGDQLSIIPMRPKDISSDNVMIRQENDSLKRQLKLALLKLKGFQILGEILDEQYGIDLLKKAITKQSTYLKNKTRK